MKKNSISAFIAILLGTAVIALFLGFAAGRDSTLNEYCVARGLEKHSAYEFLYRYTQPNENKSAMWRVVCYKTKTVFNTETKEFIVVDGLA